LGRDGFPQPSVFASEEDARKAVALPGCEWKYLRFIEKDGTWTPAAGTFEGWPKTAKELKCLDPSMGSGHFVVAMFERLVALRLAEEKLDEAAAVAAVIRDNLFGLEIDPRCTQIGAFNLALAAWRRVGHCKLPAMNLACSGLAPNTREADWLAIAGDNQKLQRGMERLYRLFQKAAVLGSLINPRAGQGDLLEAAFHELQPLLEKALAQETKDDTAHEMAVTARGLAKAAEILASQFTLVATNVPYLGRGKQHEVLQDYCERIHSEAKSDLATCFVERCLTFCSSNGTTALVAPQNWWFSSTYKNLRREILTTRSLHFAATLGEEAWQAFGDRGPFAGLVGFGAQRAATTQMFAGLDALPKKTIPEKIEELECGEILQLSQADLRNNSDFRIAVAAPSQMATLESFAKSYQGIKTGDDERICRCFWEFAEISRAWRFYQSSVSDICLTGGMELVLLWGDGGDGLARKQGISAWEKSGVLVCLMRDLPATRYFGHVFSSSVSPLVIANKEHLLPIWAFCSSPEFQHEVRKIDRRVCVTNANILKVPFDLAHWQKVAVEKYPHGLPKPFSSDPTQWLFNGHPAGADQPLHVAVARLLGYQWPRQTGSSFPDCSALGPDGLESLADADGIVCLSATKGEAPAAERLRALLAQALGKLDLPALIASAGPGGKKGSKSETLEDWLRDEFFEQHCALFHHRPFIWHLWDGHKSGFSALVNYHNLTHASLEKLTYAYLGDWIRRQQAAVDAGESGSDARLQAAKLLQTRLKLILEGEPPYDLFVRWKSLSKQAIGWHPDLNDGVRMNIRPFLATDIPGGKKGAGLLRTKPNIKWEKDRGKEPHRDKAEFPWFWKGSTFTGDRVNDVHLTREQKEATR
jgi:hypothetical protein